MPTSRMAPVSPKRAGDAVSEVIDVVVRFHDLTRISELKRCVFSLVGQSHRPIRIILAMQRVSATGIETVKSSLAPLLADHPTMHLSVVYWEHSEPADARSVLLNLGVGVAQGRYLGFLDYDDVMYPEAYATLTDRLRSTGAAIAFASVRVMRLVVHESYLWTEQRVVPNFSGRDLADLFRHNFCPLHSFLIDRERVPAGALTFDTSLAMEEDYDVLLRICAQCPSDFALIGTEIGDYYYKTDGSNTVPIEGGVKLEGLGRYELVRAAINRRKNEILVAPDVQRALGFALPDETATIAQIVARLPAPAKP